MSAYADANLLVRLFLQSPDSASILPHIRNEVLPITDLISFEVMNAVERMAFESRAGGSPWRVSPEMAALAQTDFEAQVKREHFLKRVSLSLPDIEPDFSSLVRRFTATHGFRTYDIMHVASAMKLRCKRFLSFDAKATALAKLVGLKTL
jgi:predicted nucleic acid-binding protein